MALRGILVYREIRPEARVMERHAQRRFDSAAIGGGPDPGWTPTGSQDALPTGSLAAPCTTAQRLRSGGPALRSIEELARDIGDRVVVADAVSRPDHSGSIHRLDEFVLASRAAVRAAQLGHA